MKIITLPEPNPPLGLIKRFPPPVLLSIDPGDHIGWAEFHDGKFHQSGCEYRGFDHNLNWLDSKLARISPKATNDKIIIVCESYKIFKTHLNDHIDSDVPTLRVIGALQMLCLQFRFQLYLQSPSSAKGFVTDDKLAKWNYPTLRTPHERDALRHGIYFLVMRPDRRIRPR